MCHNNIIEGAKGEKDMGYYFEASDLACYISQKFYDKYGYEISSIKLQKSLYFLFAYWGGFVNKSCANFADDRECQEMNKYKRYLFNDRIEAWTYGPVVPEIYKKFNSGIYRHSDNSSLNEREISDISSILLTLF